MENAIFASDLTDAQWAMVEPMLPPAKLLGRPRTPLRGVINAILYIAKAGCQWRMLPTSFPPWKTIYHHFRSLGQQDLWARINEQLRRKVRIHEDRKPEPTAASLDSQTVRSAAHGGPVGYDAGKKTKGRKRFIVVDVLGMILNAAVCPASQTERAGAKQVLAGCLPRLRRLKKLWVDGGFSGEKFAAWVREQKPSLDVEVISRIDRDSGFKVLPKRWVVERTFGWLMHHRRLVRDYEKTDLSAASWIYLTMIGLMLRRLNY